MVNIAYHHHFSHECFVLISSLVVCRLLTRSTNEKKHLIIITIIVFYLLQCLAKVLNFKIFKLQEKALMGIKSLLKSQVIVL